MASAGRRHERKGIVYLVGAGPGDPGLLTLRAAALLQSADVIVVDRLASPRVWRRFAGKARVIDVGKSPGDGGVGQAGINRLIVREARKGRRVVRLKGGDPVLFGRAGEEALALRKAKIPFEIVPGVTSAIAVPAYAGIPVTDRQWASSMAVITGHENAAKLSGNGLRWDRLARATDTLVCLMGVRSLPDIARQLVAHGRAASTPAAVIESGTLPHQRTTVGTLKTIADDARRAGVKPPAILVVGKVVSLRRHMAWFEKRPLAGLRILVTRAADKAGDLASRLEDQGAEVEQLPAIELSAVPTDEALRQAIRDLPETDWVFFTSPEGIRWFARAIKPLRRDLRVLAGCHIGAIGVKTVEAIEAMGMHVDFVPRSFSQEGMLQDFPSRLLSGRRGVIFSAAGARDVLDRGLRRRGMRVSRVSVYQTKLPEALIAGVSMLFKEGKKFDYVTVTSASSVEHLHAACQKSGASSRRLPFASIGPATSSAVRKLGGRVKVQARVSTIEGLVDALAADVRKRVLR